MFKKSASMIFLLAAMILVSALSGCGSKDDKSGAPIQKGDYEQTPGSGAGARPTNGG